MLPSKKTVWKREPQTLKTLSCKIKNPLKISWKMQLLWQQRLSLQAQLLRQQTFIPRSAFFSADFPIGLLCVRFFIASSLGEFGPFEVHHLICRSPWEQNSGSVWHSYWVRNSITVAQGCPTTLLASQSYSWVQLMNILSYLVCISYTLRNDSARPGIPMLII